LGQRYYGAELSFKPWPACRGTHAFIELAQILPAQHGFSWRDVEEVTVHIDPVHRMLIEPLDRKQAPRNQIDAKFSIPFTTALALVRGHVGLDDFSDASLSDPDLLAISRRVKPGPPPTNNRVVGSGGAMTIRLVDGRTVYAEVVEAVGAPGRPMTGDAMMSKFVDCLGRAARPVAKDRAGELGRKILTIDSGVDVGALFKA